MPQRVRTLTLLSVSVIAIAGSATIVSAAKPAAAVASTERVDVSALWRDPGDIASRNLYYGAGGEADQPHGPYTFEEEDMDGSNPKYVVRDRDNVKWTVKIGLEARPETAATRLVWAAGYFTNEDYFLPQMQIAEMPAKVKRGQKMIGSGGTLTNARLKRHLADEKNVGNWEWDGLFAGTREQNGLKVIMALLNNWDLKDVNNKIYSEKGSKDRIYMVADLGASFGATALSFPFKRSKDNLQEFEKSQFILRMTPEAIDFATPHHPPGNMRTFHGRSSGAHILTISCITFHATTRTGSAVCSRNFPMVRFAMHSKHPGIQMPRSRDSARSSRIESHS